MVTSDGLKLSEMVDTGRMAAACGVQAQTARVWRIKGVGPPYVRVGRGVRGRVLYRVADIIAWLQKRTFLSTAEEAVLRG